MSDRPAARRARRRSSAPGRVLRRTLRWLALATSALIVLLAIEAAIATLTVPDDGYLEDVVRERGLVLAPIAARTGPPFRADRSLFAADDFPVTSSRLAGWNERCA